uniref:4-nitrophenylphosphatase n=1 Tax=Panagrolaimus sp. JU765 TaxID=591449 RepID=A0AC34PZ96_9BILA
MTPQQAHSVLMNKYSTYIFDADGVLWRGQNVIPGTTTVVNALIEAGKQVFILTNNSTRHIDDLVSKVHALGFTKVTASNVVSSGMVAADYCKSRGYTDDPIYLIGTPALESTLEAAGVRSFGCGPDLVANYANEMTLAEAEIRPNVRAVVVSFDAHFSYPKIYKAANYLKNPDVEFIVTNEDSTFPGDNPTIVCPGSGVFAAAIRKVTGRVPKVMGKPSEAMFKYIQKFNIDPKKTVMIGDRLDTDIAFGNSHGLDTILTLTGVSTTADVEDAKQKNFPLLIPSFIVDSVASFLNA